MYDIYIYIYIYVHIYIYIISMVYCNMLYHGYIVVCYITLYAFVPEYGSDENIYFNIY